MSTLEDFENAPIGTTATSPNGNIAFKTGKSMFEWTVYGPLGRMCDSLSSDEMGGYTLSPAAPTTAREALALAWELAHPIKEGQIVPKGTEFIQRGSGGTYKHFKTVAGDRTVSAWDTQSFRSLEPLPDPEPDWLDAPAVLAATIFEDRSENRSVFVRENKDGTQWVRDTRFYRWDELIAVVPLYPKEDA